MSIEGSFITWTPLQQSQSLHTADTTTDTTVNTDTTATANTDISKSINVSTETTATQNEFSECCDEQKNNNPIFNKKKCRSTPGHVPKLNKIKFAQCISNKLKNNINDNELKSLLESFKDLTLKPGSIDNIDTIITTIYELNNNKDNKIDDVKNELELTNLLKPYIEKQKNIEGQDLTTETITQQGPEDLTTKTTDEIDCCNTKGIDTKRCNNKNPVFVPNLALRKPKKEYIKCLLGKLDDNEHTNELKYLINTYILKNKNEKSENEVQEIMCSNFNNNEDGCNKFGMCKWEKISETEGNCIDKIGEHSINLNEVITQLNKIINSKDNEEKFNGYCEKLINFIKFKSPYGSLGTPVKKQEAIEIIKDYTEDNIWKPDYLVRIIPDNETITKQNKNYRIRNPEYRKIGELTDTKLIVDNDEKDDNETKTEYTLDELNELKKKKYTPLIPGDVIYYPCAFSKESQKHFGIYIGQGYVVHLWSAITGGGIVVLTTLREFKPNAKKNCEDRTIYVLNRQYIEKELKIYFKKRTDIVKRAVEDIGKSRYNLLSSNCQHWSMRIATGTCLSFAFRPKYNKQLTENSEAVRNKRLENLFTQPPKTEPPFDNFENNPQSIQDLKGEIMKTLQEIIGKQKPDSKKNINELSIELKNTDKKKQIHITLQKKTKDTNNKNEVEKKVESNKLAYAIRELIVKEIEYIETLNELTKKNGRLDNFKKFVETNLFSSKINKKERKEINEIINRKFKLKKKYFLPQKKKEKVIKTIQDIINSLLHIYKIHKDSILQYFLNETYDKLCDNKIPCSWVSKYKILTKEKEDEIINKSSVCSEKIYKKNNNKHPLEKLAPMYVYYFQNISFIQDLVHLIQNSNIDDTKTSWLKDDQTDKFENLLMKPIQYLPRYILLYKEIVKQMEKENNPNIEICKKFIKDIKKILENNEAKRELINPLERNFKTFLKINNIKKVIKSGIQKEKKTINITLTKKPPPPPISIQIDEDVPILPKANNLKKIFTKVKNSNLFSNTLKAIGDNNN